MVSLQEASETTYPCYRELEDSDTTTKGSAAGSRPAADTVDTDSRTPATPPVPVPPSQALFCAISTIGKQLPLPSSCPASVVEQALRALILHMPRVGLVNIFKSILEDSTTGNTSASIKASRRKYKKLGAAKAPTAPVVPTEVTTIAAPLQVGLVGAKL